MSELNYLEFQFLILIKFSLFIEKDLFDKYYYNLLSFQEEDIENIEEDDNTEEEVEKTENNIDDDDIMHDGNDD